MSGLNVYCGIQLAVVHILCKQSSLASQFVVCLYLIKGLDNGNATNNNNDRNIRN